MSSSNSCSATSSPGALSSTVSQMFKSSGSFSWKINNRIIYEITPVLEKIDLILKPLALKQNKIELINLYNIKMLELLKEVSELNNIFNQINFKRFKKRRIIIYEFTHPIEGFSSFGIEGIKIENRQYTNPDLWARIQKTDH